MIVERGIAFRYRLEFIVEVNDNLTQGQHETQFHAIATDILLVYQFTTLVKTKCHDRSDVVGGCDDTRLDIGFLDMVDECRVR